MKKSELNRVINFVDGKKGEARDPQHDFSHLLRVANFAKQVIKTLGVEDKVDHNLLLAACYLHDVNHLFYPPGIFNYFLEKRMLKKVLPKVLAQLRINGDEKNILEKAIYSCPFSFPFRKLNPDGDIYTKVLQDADTLDYFSKEREENLNRIKNSSLYYFLIGLFSKYVLSYGRKNIADYLNHTQIANESYVQKS